MMRFTKYVQNFFPFGGTYDNKITYGEQYPQVPISPIIPAVIPQGNAIILFFEL